MSTNCPNWGATAPPAPPSRTPMNTGRYLQQLSYCVYIIGLPRTPCNDISDLKLMPTQFLIIGRPLQKNSATNCRAFSIPVVGQNVTPTTSALNRAVIFNGNVNFRQHISHKCHSCFDHNPDLRLIIEYIWLFHLLIQLLFS